jgi:hypothetical protein
MFKNFDCFYNAVHHDYDEKTYRLCSKSHNLVYFKLSEEGEKQSLSVSRVVGLSRYQEIGRLAILDQTKMDYETVWSVSFALEASGDVKTEEGSDDRRRNLR